MSNKKQYDTDAKALGDLRVKIREIEWNADIAREAIRIAERYRTKADNQRIMLNQLQRGRFQGSDLIRRQDVYHILEKEMIDRPLDSDRWIIRDIDKAIRSLPSADAVEVVRCKDCIHCEPYKTGTDEDCTGLWCEKYQMDTTSQDFCSRGVRSERK